MVKVNVEFTGIVFDGLIYRDVRFWEFPQMCDLLTLLT